LVAEISGGTKDELSRELSLERELPRAVKSEVFYDQEIIIQNLRAEIETLNRSAIDISSIKNEFDLCEAWTSNSSKPANRLTEEVSVAKFSSASTPIESTLHAIDPEVSVSDTDSYSSGESFSSVGDLLPVQRAEFDREVVMNDSPTFAFSSPLEFKVAIPTSLSSLYSGVSDNDSQVSVDMSHDMFSPKFVHARPRIAIPKIKKDFVPLNVTPFSNSRQNLSSYRIQKSSKGPLTQQIDGSSQVQQA
jgi:hypothetical protein